MTLDGNDVFGLVISFASVANPKAQQIREYPGVDGLARTDLGARGGRTRVEGALWGADAAGLAAAEAAVRNYQLDGGAYAFVDDYGVAWPDVVLESFEPGGRVYPLVCGVYSGSAVVGGLVRKYRASLLHLS